MREIFSILLCIICLATFSWVWVLVFGRPVNKDDIYRLVDRRSIQVLDKLELLREETKNRLEHLQEEVESPKNHRTEERRRDVILASCVNYIPWDIRPFVYTWHRYMGHMSDLILLTNTFGAEKDLIEFKDFDPALKIIDTHFDRYFIVAQRNVGAR